MKFYTPLAITQPQYWRFEYTRLAQWRRLQKYTFLMSWSQNWATLVWHIYSCINTYTDIYFTYKFMCTGKVLEFSQIPRALQSRSVSNFDRHVHVLSAPLLYKDFNEQVKLLSWKSATTFVTSTLKRIWWIATIAHFNIYCYATHSRWKTANAKLFLIPYNLWNYRWINDCSDSFMQLSFDQGKKLRQRISFSTLSLAFPTHIILLLL